MSFPKPAYWAAAFLLLATARAADARVPRASVPALFGSGEFVSHAPPKWLAALQRLGRERRAFEACAADPAACPSQSIVAWNDELERLRRLDPLARIEALNRAVNRRAYRSDFNNFRSIDYWASPTEFMARSGDCEDYVIFKMFSLMLLGFADEQLRVVLVRDTAHAADHAVLAVYLDGEIYILDNNDRRVLPHGRIDHYVPVLSFGTRRSWGHVPPRRLRSARRGDRGS